MGTRDTKDRKELSMHAVVLLMAAVSAARG